MTSKSISKVLEIENCPKDKLLEAIYKAEFWEAISPVSKIEAQMVAPNVLSTKIVDNIKVINIPIEMDGELVLIDKGDEEGKFSIFAPLIGPLSLYWFGLILSLVGGWFGSFGIKSRDRRQLYFISIITLICGFLILGMLHLSGVI